MNMLQLCSNMLTNLSIRDYLLCICKIGDVITNKHHIDVILESLSSNYASVVYVPVSKFDIMDIDEVEVLLLVYELHLVKFKKQTLINVCFFESY